MQAVPVRIVVDARHDGFFGNGAHVESKMIVDAADGFHRPGMEIVVLDIETGVYLNLNVMGSEILRRLATVTELRDLCGALSNDFTVSQDQLEREVLEFASRLLDARLIRVVA